MRTHPTPLRARRGFSLPELLISMVMIGIIGLALTRLVVNESRASNRQVLQRNARGVSRGPLNLMLSELRMAEQTTAFVGVVTGTVPMPRSDFIAINVPWAIGVRCTAREALMMPIDSIVGAVGAAWTRGFATRTGPDGGYEVEFGGTATPHSDLALCRMAGIESNLAVSMPGLMPYRTNRDMAGQLGTPVIFYYQVRYTFKSSTSVPGKLGLFRQVWNSGGGNTEEELVAPFATGSGFGYYRGTNRMPTGAPTTVLDLPNITGLQINLVGESERRAQGMANPENANVSTAVFFRNRL